MLFSRIDLVFISWILFLILSWSCEKWDLSHQSFPEIISLQFEPGFIPSEGVLTGNISGLIQDNFVDIHGHIWALDSNLLTIDNSPGRTALGKKGNGLFQSEVSSLSFGKTYYYRSYLIFNNIVRYGEIKSLVPRIVRTPVA